VRRELVGGEHAERRRSCELAATRLGVTALRDATLEMLESAGLGQPEATRAKHVITENSRVLSAVELLRNGKPEEIGRL
jgi:galactokinase